MGGGTTCERIAVGPLLAQCGLTGIIAAAMSANANKADIGG
jgi:hypothetical protein